MRSFGADEMVDGPTATGPDVQGGADRQPPPEQNEDSDSGDAGRDGEEVLAGVTAGASLVIYLVVLVRYYLHADPFPGISNRAAGVLVSIAVPLVEVS